MNVEIKPAMTIDTDLLVTQRALIGTLIGNLDCGRAGFVFMPDRDTLIGIQGILDAVADSTEGFNDEYSFSHLDDYEGPECPGCVNQDLCDDCEYVSDPDVDPVCNN